MSEKIKPSWLEQHPHIYIQVIDEADSIITEQFWDAANRCHNVPLRKKANNEIVMAMSHSWPVLFRAIWREARKQNIQCIIAVTTSATDHLAQFVIEVDITRSTEPRQEDSILSVIPVYQTPRYTQYKNTKPKTVEELTGSIQKAIDYADIYFHNLESEVRADNG